MTAVSTATATPGTSPVALDASSGTTFLNVLRSEWTKLWSLRSTRWALLAVFFVTLMFTTLFCWGTVASWDDISPEDRATIDPVGTSLGGLFFGQLVIAVLGALVITGEYSTGGIKATLSAVPQRLKVLTAKGLTFAVVALVVGTITCFAAFWIGQLFFATKDLDASLSDPGVLRAVLGGGLYVLGCGMLGFAVGTLLRHSAGSITTAIGLLFVLPLLSFLLPGEWGETIAKYLFSNAGQQITTVVSTPEFLSPWVGYAVFTLEWVAILVVGAVLMRRRDA